MSSNSALSLIKDYRDGELQAELDEALRTIVHASEETLKQGSVTLTITVSPPDRKSQRVKVLAQVKTNVPRFPPDAQSYFIGDDGLLQIRHPKQTDLLEQAGTVTDINKKKQQEG
jgi:hypothetical protein